MKRPMLYMACVCSFGILYAQSNKWYWPVCLILLLTGSGLYRLLDKQYKRGIAGSIGLLAVFSFFFFHTFCQLQLQENIVSSLENGQLVTLQGRVSEKEKKNRNYQYVLSDCSYEALPCNKVLVYFSEDALNLWDDVELTGYVSFFESAGNEGNFDPASYYKSQKIMFQLENPQLIQKNEPTGAIFSYWQKFRNQMWMIRQDYAQIIENNLDDEDAGVLEALLLGKKDNIAVETKKLYQAAGISHILAISGLHITLLGMQIHKLLRKLSCPTILNVVLCVTVLLFYGLFTGSSVSTVRAIGMLYILLIGRVLNRGEDMLNSLGALILFLLWENPFWLQYSGFLFSCGAVLSVGTTVYYWNRLWQSQQRTDVGKWKHRVNDMEMKIISCLAIQMSTLPLVAYYYYEIPTYAVWANLLLVPILPFLLCLGFGATILVHLGVGVAKLMYIPASLILKCNHIICKSVYRLPGARIICGQPTMGRMILYFIILIISILYCMWQTKELVWFDPRKKNEKQKLDGKKIRKQRVTLFLFLIAMLTVLLYPRTRKTEMVMLDVGQGLGIYIQTDSGQTIFIDGGSTDVKDVGQRRILPFLKSRGISKIDFWFLSHLDADHCNGCMELLQEGYEVSCLVLSENVIPSTTYDTLLSLAKENKTSIVYFDFLQTISQKTWKVSCLWPYKQEQTENDNSMALLFEIEGEKLFFGGDIPQCAEESIAGVLKDNNVESVLFFAASHHGSDYSNGNILLEQLSPVFTGVSCAKENSYGHPGKSAVERIKKESKWIEYTMNQGEIRLLLE